MQYINDNNFDILCLQETSENICSVLTNYSCEFFNSHCGYTYIGINHNLNVEKSKTIKMNGIIINDVKINNVNMLIESVHLSTNVVDKNKQIENIEKILKKIKGTNYINRRL